MQKANMKPIIEILMGILDAKELQEIADFTQAAINAINNGDIDLQGRPIIVDSEGERIEYWN